MSANQEMDGVQSVATTIEKIELDDNRELQWLIRNFDIIHSSSLNQISQNFGPLNGKVLIKLDLTKKENGVYELGVKVQPTNNVMWMSFQFKMVGSEDFSISGDPRDIEGNRLVHTLTIPSQKELKFTFKPEILMSVADVVVGTQPIEQETPNSQQTNSTGPSTSPFLNPQFFGAIPTFIQQTLNQRVNECNHWKNFILNCPTELNQVQQHLSSIITNSEIVREAPRMVNNLIQELNTNPDYAQINRHIQEFLARASQQPTDPQESSQQPFPNFPPSMETVQQLFQQLPSEQQSTPIVEAIQSVLTPLTNSYEQFQKDFTTNQQQYQDLITFPTTQTEQLQKETIPSAPIIEQTIESVETTGIFSQEPQIMESSGSVEENKVVEQVRAHSSTSSRQNDSAWTYVFATKGITGYVRHVKGLTNRVPYHRNFCSAQDWVLPDGKTIKVELVHALHPDAPFICLFDYDNSIDMFFVQTLLNGNGEEIHKIDSFSDSYQGFTPDMLLQSAEIDDCVRIKIEAIVDLD